MIGKGVDILLVEDDPGDVELTRIGFETSKMLIRLHVVDDGVKAMKYLRREEPYTDEPQPDLILLDLNLPKKDGREVLRDIKQDGKLKSIPVVVLTTSEEEMDVVKCYTMGANSYIAKPVTFEEFIKVVKSIEDFWLTIVKMPSERGNKWNPKS